MQESDGSIIGWLREHPVRNALLATPGLVAGLFLSIAWAWDAFTDKKIPVWVSEQGWWLFMKSHLIISGLIAVSVIAGYVWFIWILFKPRKSKYAATPDSSGAIEIGFNDEAFKRGLALGVEKLLEHKDIFDPHKAELQKQLLAFINERPNPQPLDISEDEVSQITEWQNRVSVFLEKNVNAIEAHFFNNQIVSFASVIGGDKDKAEAQFKRMGAALKSAQQVRYLEELAKNPLRDAPPPFVAPLLPNFQNQIPESGFGRPEENEFSVDFLPSKNPTHLGTYIRIINRNDSKPLKIQSLKVIGTWDGNEESFIDKPGLFQDDNEPPCEVPPEDRRDFLMAFSEAQIWKLDKALLSYYGQLELRDGRTFNTDIVKRPSSEVVVVPNISGIWQRESKIDPLIMNIRQNGAYIESKFQSGHIAHEMEGKYNPNIGEFETSTRRHNQNTDARDTMVGTYKLLDDGTMRVECIKSDGKGEVPIDWKETEPIFKKITKQPLSGVTSDNSSVGPDCRQWQWPSDFPSQFTKNAEDLKLDKDLQSALIAVMTNPEFPSLMSLNGTLVANPVWRGVEVENTRNAYWPIGPRIPVIFRADMLLIRRKNRKHEGELLTYPSKWGTHMIHFRPWKAEEDAADSNKLNQTKFAAKWGVSPEAIQVTRTGKYLVSAKINEEYNDLWIYVFEFVSVYCTQCSDQLRQICVSGFTDGTPTKERNRWRHLQEMRNDPVALRVNGDVLRALHQFFDVNLASLPDSFPENI